MPDPQYIEAEELEGRTVAKLVANDDRVLIRFTDGAYTSIVCHRYGDWADVKFEEPKGSKDLMEIGVISEEAYAAEQKAKQDANLAQAKEIRRQKYLDLKREFEGEPI